MQGYYFCLLIVICSIGVNVCQLVAASNTAKIRFKWKQMDIIYQDPNGKQKAIDNGDYIPRNVMPLCAERWGDRLFINTPLWKKGIPVTLSVVSLNSTTKSPSLMPYPDWNWHNSGNCSGITSVFRMNVDNCGVLWVLDSGQTEILSAGNQICPPKIFAIDLNTNTVKGHYRIPSEFVLSKTLTTNIIVDSRDQSCLNDHVYVTDSYEYAIIVLRPSDKKFWRFSHYTFMPEPLSINYTIDGLNFQYTDGVLNMALGEITNGVRTLYYAPLSSPRLFEVSTAVIQDPSRVSNSVNDFKLLGKSRGANSQVATAVVDHNGIMFFNLISKYSIGCWDTKKPYTPSNLDIIAKDNVTLNFPNDIRIDHESPQTLWVVANRLPLYQFDLINPNETNYFISNINPLTAIKKTACESKDPSAVYFPKDSEYN